jgi:Fe-S oxidoreductase
MCNNNGACRKSDPGVMCPSYRATGDEQHLTRGRANTLRLALSGQLGPEALVSEEMRETMALCISCKGCKRECPTGVDMAKMKVEFLYHYKKRHGLSVRDRLIAYLPRYAPYAAPFAPVLNLRNRVPALAALGEKLLGFSARRSLPNWSSRPYGGASPHPSPPPLAGEGARWSRVQNPPPQAGEGGERSERVGAREVVLLVDTFNRYFEPENAWAAERVLARAGYRVTTPEPAVGRPLCCGRTFLAAGLVEEAKAEARRMLDALAPAVAAGTPIVGLEPACLLTLRDEFPAMLPGEETRALAAYAQLFEEFVASERAAGRFELELAPMPGKTALLHGHCHQKAFGTAGAAADALRLIPELAVETFDSTCCGMAGSFGLEAEHYDMSLKIGELGVLPKMRDTAPDTLLAACGTSCRHQIADGAGRQAHHIVRILDEAST